MTPIITSTISEMRFHIEHGPDPRVLQVNSGQIAISPDAVELTIRRGLVDVRFQSHGTAIVARIMLIPILFFFALVYLGSHFPSLLFILLPGLLFLFLMRLPSKFRFTKNTVQAVQRAGRKVTLLLRNQSQSLHGIYFSTLTIDEAFAIEQALLVSTGSLPSPIHFTWMGENGGESIDFLFSFLNEVSISADGVLLNGLNSSKEFRRKMLRLGILGILALLLYCALSSIFDFRKLLGAEFCGWCMGLSALLSVAFFFYGTMRSASLVRKAECVPDSKTCSWSDISKIDRMDNRFSLTIAKGRRAKIQTRFYTLNDENADILEAALRTRGELSEMVAVPATQEIIDDKIFSNCAPGYLTIEGRQLILDGKPRESGLSLLDYKLPLALSYAGMVYLLWTLNSIFFANLIPRDCLGIMLLLFPLLPMLIIWLLLMWLLPLFTTISRTCVIHEIKGLRRLGRQITLYAPNRTRNIEKYVFYTRSEEEAEALQRALSTP